MDTTQQSEMPRMTLNKGYFKTLPGIIKICQIFLAFMTFVLSASYSWGASGGGWVSFVGIVSFVNAIIWFVFYLFNTIPPVFVSYFVELIAYGVLTFFLLIAGIVAAVAAHIPQIAATTIFAFLCFVAYLVDTLRQGMAQREKWRQRNERRVPVPTHEPANI